MDLMSVDSLDASTGLPIHSYVAFALDGQFEGKNVVEVRMVLHTSTDMDEASDSTGEIWRVEPFTLLSLGDMVPLELGMGPIAPDNGTVGQDEMVVWNLAPAVVMVNSVLHLGVLPLSEDGINYWTDEGADPPRLLVTWQ